MHTTEPALETKILDPFGQHETPEFALVSGESVHHLLRMPAVPDNFALRGSKDQPRIERGAVVP